jgi:hypothetical protein
MRGIYLQLKQFYRCTVGYFYIKIPCRCLSHVQFSFFWLWLEFFTFFFLSKISIKILLSFLCVKCSQTFWRWPPLSGPLCPRLAPRLPPRALPRPGPPPLWVGFWCPDPRPRWDHTPSNPTLSWL